MPSRNFTRWSLGKCSTAMRLRAGSGNITARPNMRIWIGSRKNQSRLRNCAKLSATMRSEEHTSELQSLMRISYAVYCLKKKTQHEHIEMYHTTSRTQTTETNSARI